MNNRKIGCFLIGVQKGGTSSFYNWLSQHPQINAPEEMKDFPFFLAEKYYAKGVGWLESFYKNGGASKPVLLTGSVNYIFMAQKTAKAIHAYNPDSKFILILRDPVKRAFSAYQYFQKLGVEKRDFEQAIDDERQGKLRSEESRMIFGYLEHGNYSDQLKAWLQYFDRSSLCIHIYEDLFKCPEIGVQSTFNFLGVDPAFRPDFKAVNETGIVRYQWMNNMVFTNKKFHFFFKNVVPVDRVLPFDKKVKFLNWLRDWNTSEKKEKQRLTPEQYAALSSFYSGETGRLSSLLGTDLSAKWKY